MRTAIDTNVISAIWSNEPHAREAARQLGEARRQGALLLSPFVFAELLAYPVPRTYWKEAVYATARPVLYIVRPKFAGQAANLAAHHPGAESVVLQDVGHALFVDNPGQFDALLQDFIGRRVWH